MKYSVLSVVSVFILFGCSASQRPKLYPNHLYNQTGQEEIESDIDYCLDLADEYVQDPGKYEEAAKNAGIGAVMGSVPGAVSGAIMKQNVGRSTAAGAAVGAIISIMRDLYKSNEPSPTYKRFAEHCLAKQGYEVYGW